MHQEWLKIPDIAAVNASSFTLYLVENDNMKPVINKNDIALVFYSIKDTHIKYNGLFVITIEEKWSIKNIHPDIQNKTYVISDNSDEPNIIIGFDEINKDSITVKALVMKVLTEPKL